MSPGKTKEVGSNFLTTTMRMVNEQTPGDIVHWSTDGLSFIIESSERFIKILPNYFKTKNYSSFVRQLNMYDFHKVKNPKGFQQFQHENFRQGRPDLLSKIKRKVNESSGEKNELEDLRLLGLEKSRIEASQADLAEMIRTIASQHETIIANSKEIRAEIEDYRKSFESNLTRICLSFLFLMKKFTPQYFEAATSRLLNHQLGFKFNFSQFDFSSLLSTLGKKYLTPEDEKDFERKLFHSVKAQSEPFTSPGIYINNSPLMIKETQNQNSDIDRFSFRSISDNHLMTPPPASLQRQDSIPDDFSLKSEFEFKPLSK